jgi:predicted AAA+ superfamily ATPase
MIFMHLRRNGYEVEYVTTKDGFETDLCARRKTDGEVKLIQVCWDMSDTVTFERELRGLKSAMTELSINSGTIVTWDEQSVIDDSINVPKALTYGLLETYNLRMPPRPSQKDSIWTL